MLDRFFRSNFMYAPDTGGAGAGGGDNGGAAGGTAAGPGGNGSGTTQGTQSGLSADDFAKIQTMLNGTLAAKEDTALKAYFKQQGLSQQEAEQAMAAFKAEKAKNQPDFAKMQQDMQTAQSAAIHAQIENRALMLHEELGVDLKSVPYILKLADISSVASDGIVNDESLKAAMNKVLEDVPQLKKQQEQTTQGFRQVGAAQSQNAGQGQETVTKAVPTKRWNRFNN